MGDLLNKVLYPANLETACEAVLDKKGAAGVDHISCKKWRRNWEERLVNLAQDVRYDQYKPAKLRTIWIPKKRRGEWRRLRVPTVSDRILQRAVLQVLHDIFEPIFLECSYGYRPGRGLKDAVQRIIDLREMDFLFVLDADIDDFFNSVRHDLLLENLEGYIHDPALINLIKLWLQKSDLPPGSGVGIGMGSPLSPLLANVFLHPLDSYFSDKEIHMVRYADDFIVLTKTSSELEKTYLEVKMVLENSGLVYEPSKTCLTSFEEGFQYLGVTFFRDTYSYPVHQKTIEVRGKKVDFLFEDYAPGYDD